MKRWAAALAAVGMCSVAACTSSTTSSTNSPTSAASNATQQPAVPSSDSASPDTSALQRQTLDSPLPLKGSGGTYSVTVDRIGSVVHPQGNPNYWVGAVIVVSDVSGSPDLAPTDFGLAPVSGGSAADDGSADSDSESKSINRSACGKIAMLADVLNSSDAELNGYDEYTLHDGMTTVTGCVTFTFDAPDKPNLIAVYDDDPESNSGAKVLGSWSVKMPTAGDKSVKRPAAPKVTYRITGNGSRSSTITYTESGSSIEQSTNARLPWTKKVSPGSDYYSVSAQDDGGTRITCEIIDTDGSILSKHTAHGQYAIAECESSG